MFKPSKYQQALFDWIETGKGNAIVKAVAGSGKTTSLIEAIKRMQHSGSVLLCAFNKSIAQELETKIREAGAGRNVVVKTYHAFGMGIISKNIDGRVNVYDGKLDDLMTEVINDKQEQRRVQGVVRKMVQLCKGFLLDGTSTDLEWLIDRYGVEADFIPMTQLVLWVQEILRRSLEMESTIDFDDMIYIPAIRLRDKEWRSTGFDWILSDESQDLNEAQRVILVNSLKRNGRLCAVGDEKQAIYGFRGADPDSMQKLQEQLNAIILPLSVCYRCPTSHLDMARQYVPEIEPRDEAPAGIVESRPFDQALQMMDDRDLVLCRKNAPLVKAAFALLSQGKKAMVKGRDIGKGLVGLIEKMNTSDFHTLLDRLNQHCSLEVAKWARLEKFSKAEAVQDQVDCIMAIAGGVDSVIDLKAKIERIFSDSVFGTVFSSVHRAKGLEAHRTFILERETMPMRWRGQQDWAFQQELNILYVALTRSKSEMYFVGPSNGGMKGSLKEMVVEAAVETPVVSG